MSKFDMEKIIAQHIADMYFEFMYAAPMDQ
jgi:hypothetical protein